MIFREILMHEVTSSPFEKSYDYNKKILEELQKKRHGSIVSVLLYHPDWQKVCLILPRAAVRDGRYNLTPPQGRIKSGETLFQAAHREMKEELGVRIDDIQLLFRYDRCLKGGGTKAHQYRWLHYHWVMARMVGDKIYPEDQIAAVEWCHLHDVDTWAKLSMSAVKGMMFLEAIEIVRKALTVSRSVA